SPQPPPAERPAQTMTPPPSMPDPTTGRGNRRRRSADPTAKSQPDAGWAPSAGPFGIPGGEGGTPPSPTSSPRGTGGSSSGSTPTRTAPSRPSRPSRPRRRFRIWPIVVGAFLLSRLAGIEIQSPDFASDEETPAIEIPDVSVPALPTLVSPDGVLVDPDPVTVDRVAVEIAACEPDRVTGTATNNAATDRAGLTVSVEVLAVDGVDQTNEIISSRPLLIDPAETAVWSAPLELDPAAVIISCTIQDVSVDRS
ncbi:MAG: hypothetical protein AAF547_11480, partial [Actinomycetota bacterium]